MKWLNKLQIILISFFILQAGSPVHAQKYDGLYGGSLSGDLNGTYVFTVNSANKTAMQVNLEGTVRFSDGTVNKIQGRVDKNGRVDALFAVTTNEVTHYSTTGSFIGQIKDGLCSGNYRLYVQTDTKLLTSVGSWSTDNKVPEKEILSYSLLMGKDLLITDTKAIALRIHIRLNDQFRDQYSIKTITVGGRNPEPGRYAPDVHPVDNFYLYTDEDGLFVNPPPGAREANYDFQYANYGTKQELSLPKSFTAKIHVTLKSENGEGDREEILMVPFQITSLCNILVLNCGFGQCPTLNNKKLKKSEIAPAVSGDKLLIPTDAEVIMKFLDGTQSYFVNKSQTPWLLTTRAGRFTSEQSWKYKDNTITIEGVAMKGLEAGGDKLSDKALEAGLKMLIIKGSSVSVPGVTLQLTQLIGSDIMAAEPLIIRLRSKLDIMFYANGTFRIRNLEGSPEVRRKQNVPLLIPVGKEVMVNQKGVVSEPVQIRLNPAEPLVKNKLEPVAWQGTWQTNWGQMIIAQNSNSITGTYEHDNGKIKGTITGNKITGTWSEAPTYLAPKDSGEFEFTLSSDGKSFTGRWRYGNKGDWQAGWDGHH